MSDTMTASIRSHSDTACTHPQDNEIKNGRLAMIAFLGFVAQHAATGKVCIPIMRQPNAMPCVMGVFSKFSDLYGIACTAMFL